MNSIEQIFGQVNSTARKRKSPVPRMLYGNFEGRMKNDTEFREKMRNRLAYVYVVGQFPSHLRKQSIEMIRTVTFHYRKPVCFDGRSGNMKLNDEVVEELDLNAHPMVRKVREKIRAGYLIQPSLGAGRRRNYWKIFMFQMSMDGTKYGKIQVQGDGAEKEGWN